MDLRPARVRVPCSTSNLGSGYDTIGLALQRHLDVTFEPDSSGELTVERSGTLVRLDEEGAPDLAVDTFVEQLTKRGVRATGTMRLTSEIPVARGLGASAAAILAGFELALAALGEPADPAAAFKAALRYEGHGDNAAPSLYGGLRAVARTPDGPMVIKLDLSDSIGFAYAAPAAGTSTKEARDILPDQVSHRLAAASLGRLVALMRGLKDGDPDLLRIGVKDELHVPHRLALIPSAVGAMHAATDAGAWAVTVSGAGSGLIAMCDPDRAADVAAAMHHVFDAETGDPECVGFAVEPCFVGVQRLDV